MTTAGAFAQIANVKAAEKIAGSGDKADFNEARRLIKEALANDETKNDPYTYYIMGLVEHNKSKAEYRKLITPGVAGDTASMFRSVVAEIYGWRKTDSLERTPDKTGRISLKYLKKVQDYVKEDKDRIYSAGLFWLRSSSLAYDHTAQDTPGRFTQMLGY